MSKTYSIACTDCKEHKWIGQGNDERETSSFTNSKQTKAVVFERDGNRTTVKYTRIELSGATAIFYDNNNVTGIFPNYIKVIGD